MRLKLYWHWYVRFWAFNTALACLIGLLYLATPSTFPNNVLAGTFAVPYFIGHFGLLCLLLFIPFFLVGAFLPLKAAIWILSGWSAFIQTLLLVDTFVYQQYRFHINLFVLDLFFNGQGQIISFSWFLWALVAAFIFGLYAFMTWSGFFIKKHVERARVLHTGKILSVWFLALLSSHIAHIFADGLFYRPITKLAFVPPFAVPANAQVTLAEYGLVDVEKHKSQALMGLDEEEKSMVAYPLEEMKCRAPEKPMNVLIIMSDSLRYDQLDETVMPATFALSKKSIVFDQHFSGSNSTRGGVFSLFYGLPPLYFEKFRESHVAPVMMNLFRKFDYEMGIYGSAPLTKPEFDQTVFAGVPNLRKKSKAQPAYLRDEEITNEFIQFLDKRDPKKNFFGFLFYDSNHEFSYPPGHTPFQPQLEEINYFTLNNNTDPTKFMNRYKNSSHFVDTLIARVYADLEKRGMLQNTIVVFTSDHGKEFNDNKLNYWGHNSNFTNPQTQVPFYIYWPGREPQRVRHWTSHYDLPATIAQDLFHCENKAQSFSSGENLFKHSGHKWILHGTYGDFGIRLADHFIVIKNTGGYEILDHKYQPLNDVKINYDAYNSALKEMRRFYK